MADPTPYTRSFSFASFQAAKPKDPPPGPALDTELDNLKNTVSSLVAAIKDIRRSDGALKNGVVTFDSLADDVKLGTGGAGGGTGGITVGPTLLYGSGAPSNAIGAEGASYVDQATGRLYGPKANGVWPADYFDLGARVVVVGGGGGPPVFAPVNTALPTIAGTPTQGQTLTATTGSWANSPTSFNRQWRRNGVAISGATGPTYLLAAADVGAAITHAVSAVNAGGTSAVVVSAATAAVAASAAPGAAAAPTVDWTSAPSDNTPQVTVAFSQPQASDVVTVQVDTTSAFTNVTSVTDTLDTGDVAANSVSLALSQLGNGTYYMRSKVTRGGVDGPWSNIETITINTTAASDTTPDAFSFGDVTGATPFDIYTSNQIVVTGIDSPTPILVVGGTYSINGGAFTAASGTVNNGDLVAVRTTASASNSTTVDVVLSIGGVSDIFSVTTAAATGGATTMDPAKTSSRITLSGGNLTATANANGDCGTISSTGKTSGLAVWEVTTNTAGGAYATTLGLANELYHFEDEWVGSDANGVGGFDTGGGGDVDWYAGGNVGYFGGLGYNVAGTVTQFAADFTNKRLWMRVKRPADSAFSVWNSDGTADPATGTGGLSFATVSGPYHAAAFPGGIGTSFTFNFGATAFAGTIPSGYSAWG